MIQNYQTTVVKASNFDARGIPPNDPQSEAGALACVLSAAPTEAAEMFAQLTEDEFYSHQNLTVFRAIAQLEADGRPLTTTELFQYLQADGKTDDAGGMDYIQRLPDQTPSTANFPTFLEAVKDRAARRSMLARARILERDALDLRTPAIEQSHEQKDDAQLLERRLPGIKTAG